MKGFIFLFFCGFVAGTLADNTDFSALVNCSSSQSMRDFMQKCIDVNNVPMTLPPASVLDNATQATSGIMSFVKTIDKNQTEILCRPTNRDKYISATVCIQDISRKCLDNPVMKQMVPTPSRIRKQTQFLCDHIAEYDQNCINSKLEDVFACVNVTNIRRNADIMDPDYLSKSMCASFSLTKACAKRYISSCGQSTYQIYEQNFPYMPICDNFTDTNNESATTTINCKTDEGVRRGYLDCLQDSSILLILPDHGRSDTLAQFILRKLTLDQNQHMCRSLPAVKDAISCTLAVQRQCIADDSLLPTVPDTAKVQDGMDKLCKNFGAFDFDCAMKTSETACQSRKKRSTADRSILKHICSDTNQHNVCLVNAAKSCTGSTSAMYKDLLSSQLPKMCIGTSVGDNSSFKPALSIPLFVLSLVLLH